ncbi:hypothetical protein [Streptomyces sp. NPDC029041]
MAWLEMRRSQPGNASQLLRRLGLGEIPLTTPSTNLSPGGPPLTWKNS